MAADSRVMVTGHDSAMYAAVARLDARAHHLQGGQSAGAAAGHLGVWPAKRTNVILRLPVPIVLAAAHRPQKTM